MRGYVAVRSGTKKCTGGRFEEGNIHGCVGVVVLNVKLLRFFLLKPLLGFSYSWAMGCPYKMPSHMPGPCGRRVCAASVAQQVLFLPESF